MVYTECFEKFTSVFFWFQIGCYLECNTIFKCLTIQNEYSIIIVIRAILKSTQNINSNSEPTFKKLRIDIVDNICNQKSSGIIKVEDTESKKFNVSWKIAYWSSLRERQFVFYLRPLLFETALAWFIKLYWLIKLFTNYSVSCWYVRIRWTVCESTF